jgi:glycosyltransferase involved in cell wall biosynthesis
VSEFSAINNQPTLKRKDCVFVSPAQCIKGQGPPGGVQICTTEYVNTIEAAGFNIREVLFQADARSVTRLKRFFYGRRAYFDYLPTDLVDRVVNAMEGASVAFLNQVDLTPIVQELRTRMPATCKLVLLSHGTESVDYLHSLRSRVTGGTFVGLKKYEQRYLGRILTQEASYRQYLDAVVCLAPFEAEIERWLGSKRVTWLPRTIPIQFLDWKPIRGRLGFVGTLNHPPNREGLELFLRALSSRISISSEIRLRLVGGPSNVAEMLTRQYPWVEYLGPLDDDELRREAATWSCFCHPLFCYARGCSTKLAIGISWGIPIITTPAGQRGYEWRAGQMPVAESPKELAELAILMTDMTNCDKIRSQIQTIASSSPKIADVANTLNEILNYDRPA